MLQQHIGSMTTDLCARILCAFLNLLSMWRHWDLEPPIGTIGTSMDTMDVTMLLTIWAADLMTFMSFGTKSNLCGMTS